MTLKMTRLKRSNHQLWSPSHLSQPVVEPISPAQHVPEGKTKIAAGAMPTVQSTDDVIMTTPPGSPPVTPGHEDGRPNTDDIDTDKYEDSTCDQNIINGRNASSDNKPSDTVTPTDIDVGCNVENMNGDNIDSIYDGNNINTDNNDHTVINVNPTMDVNIGNSPIQSYMNSDNINVSSNADDNQEVVNGNNNGDAIQNEDTNGHNIVETDSMSTHQNVMNICNIEDSTSTNLTESVGDGSPSPCSSSNSDDPEKSLTMDPHKEIHIYGSVKVHNQVLDLWLYEAETRKTYVSVPKMSDEDVKKWTDPESLKPLWQDLYLYSLLEEIFSDDDNNKPDIDTLSYNMRERKPKNISSHPQHNRKDINYVDLCDDNTDPPSPKRAKRHFNSLREPSALRIAAQSKITEHKLKRQATNQLGQSDAAELDADTNNNEILLLMPESDTNNKDESKLMSKSPTPKPKQRPRPASKPPPKLDCKESATMDSVLN